MRKFILFVVAVLCTIVHSSVEAALNIPHHHSALSFVLAFSVGFATCLFFFWGKEAHAFVNMQRSRRYNVLSVKVQPHEGEDSILHLYLEREEEVVPCYFKISPQLSLDVLELGDIVYWNIIPKKSAKGRCRTRLFVSDGSGESKDIEVW